MIFYRRKMSKKSLLASPHVFSIIEFCVFWVKFSEIISNLVKISGKFSKFLKFSGFWGKIRGARKTQFYDTPDEESAHEISGKNLLFHFFWAREKFSQNFGYFHFFIFYFRENLLIKLLKSYFWRNRLLPIPIFWIFFVIFSVFFRDFRAKIWCFFVIFCQILAFLGELRKTHFFGWPMGFAVRKKVKICALPTFFQNFVFFWEF